MLMSLGLLFASPEMRLPRLFNGTGISNSSARRILPPVFLVPIVAGWVILQGEWLGLYSKALGFALFVMLTITLLVGFIYWSIIHLEQLETEKALAEDKFRQVEQDRVALEQGRELVQLREELVMMVSHDLRTPLAVILSSSDMLDRYAEKMNSDQRRLTLKRIKNQIGYMKILIEDATMLNQSSAGKHEFQPHLVNVNEFCMDVVEQIKIIDEGIHQFALDIPVSLPPGQVDDVLLRRILYNLLVNAMKYSPEGGEIRLSVIGSPHLLYFKVSDQGIGIPFKDRDRIFQMFARANNVHQITGSGLGLAIVYESVQIHGGKIDFSSEEGKGTTFTFWLPAA
jgi:signal transduction histidine kinase